MYVYGAFCQDTLEILGLSLTRVPKRLIAAE